MMRFRQRETVSPTVLGVAVLVSVLHSACVTRTQQYTFEVRRGASFEERLENAKAVATEDRLTRLKQELKTLHPDLTESQLSRIGVRWLQTWSPAGDGAKADRSVLITVIMQEQPGADTAAVVLSAARVLDADVNGPENSAIDPATEKPSR